MSAFATIEGRVLARAIKMVLPLVQRWPGYPALQHMHIAVVGGTMELTSSNLDSEITVRLDLNDAGGDWRALVAPWSLLKLAGMAGRDLLRLSPDGTTLVVVQDGVAEFRLEGLGEEEFPRLSGKVGAEVERFESGLLPTLLSKVTPFVSNEETRYYLCGVAWQAGAFGRRLIGTDGHRLAIAVYRSGPEPQSERLIPAHVLPLLMAWRDGAITVSDWSTNKPAALQFDAGDRRIRTALIEGTYPDVDRVIPKSTLATFVVGRDALMQATARAMALNHRRFDGGHALRFGPAEDGGAQISAKHADFGAGTVRVKAKWPEGIKPFGVNGAYLKAVLNTCSGEVKLGLSDDGGPVAFADIDGTVLRLLMPMRAD